MDYEKVIGKLYDEAIGVKVENDPDDDWEYPKSLQKAAEDAIAAIEELEARIPKWNKMPERKPEEEGWYMVFCGDYEGGIVDFGIWDGRMFDVPDVTHWMEVPFTPDKEDEDADGSGKG